jgi:hypothetical protein
MVQGWLDAAEGAELHGQMWDGSSSVESALAVLRVVQRFKTGDVGQAGEAARHALELESEGGSFGRTAALLLLGATRYWADDLEEAVEALDEAARLARGTGNDFGSMYASDTSRWLDSTSATSVGRRRRRARRSPPAPTLAAASTSWR